MPEPRVPELRKKPGVVYAVTDDGVELPVIDVTHPAFSLTATDAELQWRSEAFIRDAERRRRVPPVLQRLMYRIVLRNSVIARGIAAAKGSFLSSLHTYLLELGADNLGSYAAPIDRKIAASLPGLGVRLRLQDVALLLASRLGPILDRRSGAPCSLVNIGGGSAIDTLNALILVRRDRPHALDGRRITIDVLDLDPAGPHFGRGALAALQAEGAALAGVDVVLNHVHYTWSDAATQLPPVLHRIPAGAIVAVSSDGALFVYGSDVEVVANLRVLLEASPPDTFVVGSQTRDDGPAPYLDSHSGIPLHPRSKEAFAALVRRADWLVSDMIERPFGRNVVLTKDTSSYAAAAEVNRANLK
jgi:hypothetical protein